MERSGPEPGAGLEGSGPEVGAGGRPEKGAAGKSEEEWRRELTPEQYRIAREGGTEHAFTGAYWDEEAEGVYRCVCCGAALFTSEEKYESGSGWPSFWRAVDEGAVRTREDRRHGMRRTEVLCSRCDAHLGHVFPDGPEPTGLRYCVNSASLDLDRDADPGEVS